MDGDDATVLQDQRAFTVLMALAVNLGIMVAKLVAALITGASALLAEALHTFADSGNEALLLVAVRRAGRQADGQHPLGHGREAYFWALIASLGVFVVGAFFSVRQGVKELLHPVPASDFVVAYVVLGVSLALEALSLRRAYGQLHEEAHRFSRNLLEHLLLTSDPTTRAVFGEDAAAVAGNAIAIVGVALHQMTGSVVPDAGAAILIGVLLGGVGLELTRRNRDFLIGEPAPSSIRKRIHEAISSQTGIVAVRELVVTFVGPQQLWVVTRVDVDDRLDGEAIEELTRRTEEALREISSSIVRVDVVPAGP